VAEDERQLGALAHLDALYRDLQAFAAGTWGATNTPPEAPKGFFRSLFQTAAVPPSESDAKRKLSDIKGLYLYGGVGCGKSFLMDLFYAEVAGVRKKRVHFNAFMLSVHQGIHKYKRQDRTTDGISQVMEDLAREADLLCFDEMQVTDIADAMILRRLFAALYDKGMVVVATSNRSPGELYKGGLNREVFLPFIALIKAKCTVHNMSGRTDYRTTGHRFAGCYFVPLNKASTAKLRHLWMRLTEAPEAPRELTVFGRPVSVPVASGRMARFTFPELCSQARSAADYEALAKEFHTLFIEGVPLLSLNLKAEVRRLITLVDELYERKVKLFCTAAAHPARLLAVAEAVPGQEGHDADLMDALDGAASLGLFNGQEEKFAFARCVSRLQEMQTREYLELPHAIHGRAEYVDHLLESESASPLCPTHTHDDSTMTQTTTAAVSAHAHP